MAIEFKTSNPNALLTTFKKAIDNKHVVTWSYDKDGDFTHTTSQWVNEAWMRPKIQNGVLLFNILKPENRTVSREVYGIYHGRLIESFTVHCSTLFTLGSASANPTTGDIV